MKAEDRSLSLGFWVALGKVRLEAGEGDVGGGSRQTVTSERAPEGREEGPGKVEEEMLSGHNQGAASVKRESVTSGPQGQDSRRDSLRNAWLCADTDVRGHSRVNCPPLEPCQYAKCHHRPVFSQGWGA